MNREFLVANGREQDFENLFRFDGEWVRLLRGSGGYVRTELTKEVAVEGFYTVLDVWKSHYHFESFRTSRAEDLKQFAEMVRASGIVVSEVQLGAYYGSDDSGSDEGTLAPA